VFGWFECVHEAREHGQSAEIGIWAIQMARGTLENWQSEFLQLIWQVAGLAILWHVGSPQSKEGDDRKEEKLDEILRKLDPGAADGILARLDRKYPRK
jgi:hypothetical protein